MEEEDKQYLLQAIFDVINSIDRFSQSRDANVDYQELMLKLDFLQRLLVNMNLDDSICANVGEAYNILFNMEQMEHQSRQELQTRSEENNAARQVSRASRGRPSYDIKEEQLSFLLEKGFKVSEISKIIGVSKRTIERRMAFFGHSVSGTSCYSRSKASATSSQEQRAWERG
ncbi:Nuclear pore complex Nup107 [Paramuricea clavata]|uniref:Nuclear pore complex Nup107 n=1 Tax=Paramuricea clavata TaxID=317549 RepID=A0A7D9IQC6_PARCT|nr:Nuclear pore complex Nup107 [Paramuricea clavata]